MRTRIGTAAPRIELGSTHYGVLHWSDCESLRDALEVAKDEVKWNTAYPYQIRVDGVVRWERLPGAHLTFRWRRVHAPS